MTTKQSNVIALSREEMNNVKGGIEIQLELTIDVNLNEPLDFILRSTNDGKKGIMSIIK